MIGTYLELKRGGSGRISLGDFAVRRHQELCEVPFDGVNEQTSFL